MNTTGKTIVYDILLRSKATGAIIRTQCNSYVKYGNLRRFLKKHEDKFDVLIVEPAPGTFISWETLKAVIE